MAVATLLVVGNSLRQNVHTHRASVHQAMKLVAALLRVAWVTVGLAECNGSLPAVYDSRHLQIRSGSLCSAVEYGLPLTFYTKTMCTALTDLC